MGAKAAAGSAFPVARPIEVALGNFPFEDGRETIPAGVGTLNS